MVKTVANLAGTGVGHMATRLEVYEDWHNLLFLFFIAILGFRLSFNPGVEKKPNPGIMAAENLKV